MIALLLLLFQSPFEFTDIGGGRIQLNENGAPVWVYNYGPQLKPGVPEDRTRCCYLHPVNTPAGVTVTDDFPRDHYHHRGLFWAWMTVRSGGKIYDLWTLKGDIQHRFGRWINREVTLNQAILEFEQDWYAGGAAIVRERVRMVTSKSPKRRIDWSLSLEALQSPVEISGSPDSKGYSGFSIRFAPRTNTVIATDHGVLKGDEDHGGHRWAEFTASYHGQEASVRVDAASPIDWTLRQYGFVSPSFPGRKVHRLEKGKPLNLAYTVTLKDR